MKLNKIYLILEIIEKLVMIVKEKDPLNGPEIIIMLDKNGSKIIKSEWNNYKLSGIRKINKKLMIKPNLYNNNQKKKKDRHWKIN